MRTHDLFRLSDSDLKQLQTVTRRAMRQSGEDQHWRRFDEAVELLALVDAEIAHRVEARTVRQTQLDLG